MIRALVLGSGGMLGRELVATVPAGVSLTPSTGQRVDITRPEAVAAALEHDRPDWVLNAAAYTAVDRAETDRAQAMEVNAHAVGRLGVACAARRMRVLHFSTDYVFDGTSEVPYREDDPVAPVNVYGATKQQGERLLLESAADALVLRTQWLFAPHGRSFPRTMFERACRRQPTQVVDDQWGSPSFATEVARTSWATLLAKAPGGIYHVANTGAATWYKVARQVFHRFGADALLSPCATKDFPTPARRPKFSVLSCAKLRSVVGLSLSPWNDALGRLLDMLEGERHEEDARDRE